MASILSEASTQKIPKKTFSVLSYREKREKGIIRAKDRKIAMNIHGLINIQFRASSIWQPSALLMLNYLEKLSLFACVLYFTLPPTESR